MPCYNSLAADRYAEELGQLEQADEYAATLAQEALDTFMGGEDIDQLDTEDVLTNVWESPDLYRLIEHAWHSGEYRYLGTNIEELIRDHAEATLSTARLH